MMKTINQQLKESCWKEKAQFELRLDLHNVGSKPSPVDRLDEWFQKSSSSASVLNYLR